jgi:ASC-1-like (ASCH) protein
VESRRHRQPRTELAEKSLPKFTREFGIAVRYNSFRQSMQSKYVIEEYFGDVGRSAIGSECHEMRHLRKHVDEDNYGVVAIFCDQ